MKNQKGFTLIELIIVIIVLGILAVTAAPKFLDFTGDARAATLDGMQGGMSGASSLVFAKSAIDGLNKRGLSGSNYATTTGGIEVIYGYPAASQQGIAAAMDFEVGDWEFAYDDVSENAKMRVSPKGMNDSVDSSDPESITSCYIEYNNATSDNSPVISKEITGC